MPETVASIGKSLLRIVFRGGSPERIRYSGNLLIGALLGTVAAAIAVQIGFFQSSAAETGLGLFTLLSGVYLGSALLSRRISRVRLRVAVQSLWLLLLAILLALLVLIPLVRLVPELRPGLAVAAAIVLLLGLTAVVHYLRRGRRRHAAMLSIAFVTVLGAFYEILHVLLEILFT
jgi:drug/metabolite transporter (DMT)-like permease